jgi:hypothetical protein
VTLPELYSRLESLNKAMAENTTKCKQAVNRDVKLQCAIIDNDLRHENTRILREISIKEQQIREQNATSTKKGGMRRTRNNKKHQKNKKNKSRSYKNKQRKSIIC